MNYCGCIVVRSCLLGLLMLWAVIIGSTTSYADVFYLDCHVGNSDEGYSWPNRANPGGGHLFKIDTDARSIILDPNTSEEKRWGSAVEPEFRGPCTFSDEVIDCVQHGRGTQYWSIKFIRNVGAFEYDHVKDLEDKYGDDREWHVRGSCTKTTLKKKF